MRHCDSKIYLNIYHELIGICKNEYDVERAAFIGPSLLRKIHGKHMYVAGMLRAFMHAYAFTIRISVQVRQEHTVIWYVSLSLDAIYSSRLRIVTSMLAAGFIHVVSSI
jgi:hypothetical protein